MKRSIALVLALVLAFVLSGVVFAAETAAPSKPAAATKTETQKPAPEKIFKGKVVSVDAIANTIVVKGNKAEGTFQVDPAAKIVINKKEAKLADIKKDQKVAVTYKEEGGKKVAVKIK